MGHSTAAALTASQLFGVASTAIGVVALYFREHIVDAVRTRRE